MISRLQTYYVLALFAIIAMLLISYTQDTSQILEEGYGY